MSRLRGQTALPVVTTVLSLVVLLGAAARLTDLADHRRESLFAVDRRQVASLQALFGWGAYWEHREWVIRMFALAAGVGTIRVVGLGLVALGMGMRDLIGWSFGIGWALSLAAAEWWIRSSRGVIPIERGPGGVVSVVRPN